MQANLRRAGWRFVSALAVMLGSQTLAVAQFSTAIPAVKEKELPPPPTFPSSPPPSNGARSLPNAKTSSAAEQSRKPLWPRLFLPQLLGESRNRDESASSDESKSHAAQATRPRPFSAPAKNQITTVSHRFVDGAAPVGSAIPPARTTGTSRIPDIRLRPIGVIPPEDK